MPFRTLTFGGKVEPPAFELKKFSKPNENENENLYYVDTGFLFDTFSYNVQDSVPILGLYDDFDLKPNHKVYIEIDVDSSLQVRYAEIKCKEVNTQENWKYYPFHSLIEPEFTEDQREKLSEFPWDSGRILGLPKGRRQTKLYILIGYRGDDKNKNGDQLSTLDDDPSPVQILKENIILLGSIVDSAPGLIPIPYFYGGKTHLESIIQS
jgi:hypothetical protein